jgi:arylsulfatase A-like enzyme
MRLRELMRPNILYIHSHDTGRMIQPYGHAVPTPNLQRLAEEGVLFRQAFCAAPTCSPSRAALLTGQCAHSSGMLGLAHRGFALNDMRQHLVHTLRGAGYASSLVGVQHVARDARQIGYDQVMDTATRQAQDVAPAAAAFLRQAPTQPFFLDVGFFETHREFPPQIEPGDAHYALPPPSVPNTPETRLDMAGYKASARLLDEGVGVVLAALAESGLAENTLVISTTDHGVAFPGCKCNLSDHGIGVMLLLRGPGGFSGGQVCEAMVSHVDIFPTLCDLLQIARPSWVQGKSFFPLIRGDVEQINEAIFAEVNYHAAYEPQRAVRTQRYKYIRRYGQRTLPVLPNCDDSPSKDVWLQHGWAERPVPVEQLYDLVFDPHETHNLAGDAASQATLAEMSARLARWMEETGDPLAGAEVVPAPPGVQLNDPAGRSPREPVSISY